MFSKWIKFFIGLLLLPVCYGAGKTLWLTLKASGSADTTWIPMLAGAACWLVVFILLPAPMYIYVFGHELTHAVWAMLFGGRVKKFKVSSNGGHVVVTKDNFIITLAPYFFPIYAALVILLFGVGHLVWNLQPYQVWFHLLLGIAYSFHVTLTWHILKTRQSDITSQGYIFSAVIIFLGNALVLLIALPLLTKNVGLDMVARWWFDATFDFLDYARMFLAAHMK
ncbi:MAG: M50 family metallopeptidase [Verrucomicrobiota bacterium]